jgi:cell division septation protein DedD
MSGTFQSVGANASERRCAPRQRVSFVCIQLDDDNGGLILDISERGLSVQAVAILAQQDEVARMRFQLSPAQPWIETRGRLAWLGGSLKTAGVEFVGLPGAARDQIKQWISLKLQADESAQQIAPRKMERSKDDPEGVIPFPESETIGSVAGSAGDPVESPPRVEKGFQRSRVKPAVSNFTGSPPSTTPAPLSWSELEARICRQINARERAGVSGTSRRLIGLTAGAALLLSVLFFLLGHQLRESRYSQQHVETNSPPKIAEPSTDDSGRPANATVDAPRSSDRSGFLLQVGAMAVRENADALAETLQRRNFPAFVSLPGAGRFYRVVVGPYGDADSMLRAEEQLKAEGFDSIRRPWKPSAGLH